MRRIAVVAIVGLVPLLSTVILAAPSIALRGLDKGSKVPDLEFRGISAEGGSLSSFAGQKGIIVIFWATWSSRSPAILEFAEKTLRQYEAHGMKLLAVNVDHQEMTAEDVAAVKAKAAELGISFPVVLDAGLKAYNEIGVISTPTTLILDRDLRIVDAYPGFPSIARTDLPERIDAHLGIVREKPPEKARYLLAHTPKNHALMYYNLGRQLFVLARSATGELRGVPEDAIDRLDEAIRRDPDFFRPYLLKAIVFDMAKAEARREAALRELKKHEFQEVYERSALGLGYLYMGMDALAADHFLLAAAVEPDNSVVLFGQAVLAARGKNGAAAKRALGAIAAKPKAAEELGFDPAPLFTDAGDIRSGSETALQRGLERLLEIAK